MRIVDTNVRLVHATFLIFIFVGHLISRILGLVTISPDKARKGVIYPLKTGIYALVRVSKRTFTR